MRDEPTNPEFLKVIFKFFSATSKKKMPSPIVSNLPINSLGNNREIKFSEFLQIILPTIELQTLGL